MRRLTARSSLIAPLAAAGLLAILLVTACAAPDEPAPEPDPLIRTDLPSTEMTAADYGELEPSEMRFNSPWSRNTISNDANPEAPLRSLVDVRAAQSRGFDRVVFQFEESLPGYRLTLSHEAGGGCDGSGPVHEAAAHLVVEFSGARAHDDAMMPLIGNSDMETGFPALAHATQSCDAEGTVRWILGMGTELEYRILEMRDAPRLVVDLRHPDPAAGG